MSDTHENDPSQDIGIVEGHATVPFWLKLIIAVLFVSVAVFYARYMIDAQPSTAR